MIKGAIIGFGRMGLTHFSILNNHPEVEFVAVTDLSSFMLRNVGRYIDVKKFKNYRKMIDRSDLDFVIAATPTGSHAEIVKYAINKGLHVFVEKPFSLNSTQGRELVAMLDGTDLVGQVGYAIRFSDVFMQVKRLLDSKAIGDLTTFKMEMHGPTILKGVKSGWRSRKKEGGGCLHDFASHGIDLINYLIGVPDEVCGSVFQSIYSVNLEDAISSTFVYRGNLRGNLLVNWSEPSYRKPAYKMEIFGRKGKIVADLHSYKVFFRDEPGIDSFSQGWNQRYVTDFVEPVRFYVRGFEFTRQLDYFIDCIVNENQNEVCSFEDGLKTDIIIERIAEDAGKRKALHG